MRSLWKGEVGFGLVTVPVRLYAATEDHDLHLHQVHDADGGRIRYERRCDVCGRVVDYDHIDRAYDDGEQTVVLTEDDLATLPVEHDRRIEVVEFVPSEQVDPIRLDRSYFLEPASESTKAYVLLRRTLEATDRTAIVQLSLRRRTRLAAMRVYGSVLMLQTLLWDDEVRDPVFDSLERSPRVTARELEMSASLVEQYSGDFDPGSFSDEYQEELGRLVEAKLAQGDALDTAETFGEEPDDEGDDGEVLDLMAALRRSVETRRRGAGAAGSGTSKADTAKSGASKSSTTKSGGAKSGAAKSGTSKSGASKSSATKTGTSKKKTKTKKKTEDATSGSSRRSA